MRKTLTAIAITTLSLAAVAPAPASAFNSDSPFWNCVGRGLVEIHHGPGNRATSELQKDQAAGALIQRCWNENP